MADDIFGDESLFSEFEKDREQQNIFISFEQDDLGGENRSRIVFTNAESDEEDTDDEDVGSPNETDTTQESGTGVRDMNAEQGGSQQVFADEDFTQDFYEQGGPQSTAYQERFELNKFRHFARMIDSTRYVDDELSPGVQVIFQNNTFARKHRQRIEQFIMSLTEQAKKSEFGKPSSDLPTRGYTYSSCVDMNDKLPPEKRSNRMWQTHAIVGCAQFHQGFMVDCRGWPLDAIEPTELKGWELPRYLQVFDEIYPPAEEKDEGPPKPAVQKESCFNCGGDHRLNDCKQEKDMARIRNKRREHQEKNKNKVFSVRYHKDPELDPKKPRFRAGEISQALREAMGLRPDQLPLYVYKMRAYGYPPGWLMEANKKGYALAMYDKDGNETNLRGESLEDGEVGADSTVDPTDTEAFDIEKIIEYPGFTVPVPPGFVDESALLGLPTIQEHQLKRTLVEDITAKEAAKKRQLEEEEARSAKRLKVNVEDMEIEDEDESPLPTVTSTPTEAKKAEPSEDSSRSQSPSMDSLLQQQELLKQELKSENGENTLDANEEDSNSVPPPSSEMPNSDMVSPSSSRSTSDADYLRQQNFSFTSSMSLSKDYGTPIHYREGSFRALPSDEKFSQGIEDHIPYENLPDATGTFDRMRNLFKMIREKVKGSKKK